MIASGVEKWMDSLDLWRARRCSSIKVERNQSGDIDGKWTISFIIRSQSKFVVSRSSLLWKGGTLSKRKKLW
jgi:hypothetical protein